MTDELIPTDEEWIPVEKPELGKIRDLNAERQMKIIRNSMKKLENALEMQYQFPYYSLIRITTRHYGTFHIKAVNFNGSFANPRSYWAGHLPIASDLRTDEYFECPICGEKSFYSWLCDECSEMYYDSEVYGQYTKHVHKFKNEEALISSVKKEFLRRLDSGMTDLGIVKAEIVLPVTFHDPDGSPFLKCSKWAERVAKDYIVHQMESFLTLYEREDFKQVLINIEKETGIPFGYMEGEEIEVAGTTELRRQLSNYDGTVRWEHKHPDTGHDYWHPIEREHKSIDHGVVVEIE